MPKGARRSTLRQAIDFFTFPLRAFMPSKKGANKFLAHEYINFRPFHDAGFRAIHVEGPLYELVPPGSESYTRE
jgi:hypothetical protein